MKDSRQPSETRDAEQLLRETIALAPEGRVQAYADLAALLCRLDRVGEAIALLDAAIAQRPGEVWPLSIKAAVLTAECRAAEALDAHKAVVAHAPHASVPWMNYAQALQTVGDIDNAVAAYRTSLDRDPGNGSSWWGLANLRTVQFAPEDVAVMENTLSRSAGGPLRHIHLHFALGKAWSDLGNYERSFRYYEKANELRGRLIPYDAKSTSHLVDETIRIFTPEFLAARRGSELPDKDVIFIIGMPRSGSTLVEQILASHPMIEGAGELFDLRNTIKRLTSNDTDPASLPEMIAGLTPDGLREIGTHYLHAARRHRQYDRLFFTDKMPSNWQLALLIHLILPNAKIIDVRRNPLACCFSSFATYFNAQTSFPNSLTDLAQYYQDYLRMMNHMDAILPGRVHHIHHENLVSDVETQVRGLLDYLQLPFDPACLLFHENPRPVHTPSAQQVRRPINRDGLDQWRHYDRWLGPVRKQCEEFHALSADRAPS